MKLHNVNTVYIYIYIYIILYIYILYYIIYIYIYIYIHGKLFQFDFQFFSSIKKVGPSGIRNHYLEFMIDRYALKVSYLTEQWDLLNGLQNQVTTKHKSLGDYSGRFWITLAAKLLCELILGEALYQPSD